MSEYLFTSESVTEGHPDKLCDQVSDAILDALIKDDKGSRVACETLTKTGFVCVAGEITSQATVKIPDVIRQAVLDIGDWGGLIIRGGYVAPPPPPAPHCLPVSPRRAT